MTEIWKDVEGYEGIYKISNKGNIKGLDRLDSKGDRRKERILKCSFSGGGYARISLVKKDSRHTFKIHRLVAIHFIANPEGKPQVNHIDGDKTNNSVTNLEWNTCSENLIHAHKEGLSNQVKGERVSTHKLSEIEAKLIKDMKGKELSPLDIGKMFNISSREVSYIQNNQRWVNI